MTKIHIDPELEKVWLPPSEEEYSTLKSQIQRDGILDPLRVWDHDGELVLLDGHTRLKICRELGIQDPETTTIDISSLDEAIVWSVDNQLGRRNATKEQQAYNSGRRYKAMKNLSTFKGNQHTQEAAVEIPPHQDPGRHKTSESLAKTEGVHESTVRANAKFAEGIDTIRDHNPDLAKDILAARGKLLNKSEVEALSRLKDDLPDHKLKEIIQAGPEAIREIVKESRSSSGSSSSSKPKQPKKAVLNAPMELWCKDCEWGFDIYPSSRIESTSCPYCKGDNLDKREENWEPTEANDVSQE